jgi:phospholipid-transporting ATPase
MNHSKREKRQDPLIISFGVTGDQLKGNFDGNRVRTQRYTAFSFAPLSLLYQFKRVSNIYFLIISILTFMPFSPKVISQPNIFKNPVTMISTFVFVLVFTMIKEAYEVGDLA